MLIGILVFFPIITALLLPLIKHLKENSDFAEHVLILGTASLSLALSLILLFQEPLNVALPRLSGLGVTFHSGSLRNIMAVFSAFMWLMTALALPEYFSNDENRRRYYIFYLWTLGALMGVFFAEDLFTLFIFFEIMSFTSYVWVVQNETEEAIKASETYLGVAVIGGLTMLLGIVLLYDACGDLRVDSLSMVGRFLSEKRRLAVGLCLMVGFGAKAGLFPLHIWLPKAHPAAPAPASALLSGMLTKSGVFGVIAVSCHLFEDHGNWGEILLIPALITMLLGAVLAVFSTDLKRTLACSSMSQIGFILTGVGMCHVMGEHGSIAAYGSALHIVNHSLIKLALFVGTGVLYLNTHSLNLNQLRGSGRGKPLLMLCFLAGACSIAGIPGFGGYISKTLLHESIVEHIHHLTDHGLSAAPYVWAERIFLFSGGLTFAYMTRLFYIIFLAHGKERHHEEKQPYMGKPTAFVLVTVALIMLLFGLSPHRTLDRIGAYAAPFFRRTVMDHAVHYFAWVNLKGALIAIGIGLLVYYLVGRKWLTSGRGHEEWYRHMHWPEKLDMEHITYRPALRALSRAGVALARGVERFASGLARLAIALVFLGVKTTTPSDRPE